MSGGGRESEDCSDSLRHGSADDPGSEAMEELHETLELEPYRTYVTRRTGEWPQGRGWNMIGIRTFTPAIGEPPSEWKEKRARLARNDYKEGCERPLPEESWQTRLVRPVPDSVKITGEGSARP